MVCGQWGCGHRRQPCSVTWLRPGQSAVMPLGAHGVLPTCPRPPSSPPSAPWPPWARLCLWLWRLNLHRSQQVTEVGAGGPGARPATLGPVDEGGWRARPFPAWRQDREGAACIVSCNSLSIVSGVCSEEGGVLPPGRMEATGPAPFPAPGHPASPRLVRPASVSPCSGRPGPLG